MTTNNFPTLSADAIREAFVREAEADTQLVIQVAERVARFQQLVADLETERGELAQLYRDAEKRPNVAAKLAELGVPAIGALTGGSGGSRSGRGGASRRPSKRTARGGTAKSAAASKPAAPTSAGPAATVSGGSGYTE